MADLLYSLAHAEPRLESALLFALDAVGVQGEPGEEWEAPERPHLVHGSTRAARSNSIVIAERREDVFWPALLAGKVHPADLDGVLPFDLLNAIAALLTDSVHDSLGPAARDEHGRLRFAESLQARSGWGNQPIIDMYVAFLGQLLEERFGLRGRPRWPEGRTAAVGLSHDVDLPDRYALLASARRPWRFRRHPRMYLLESVELARARVRDPDPASYWSFDRLAAAERALGFASTFFFACTPFYSRWGTPMDVAYDVREPRFRRTLRSLAADGFEVGLHASYRAHEDAMRVAAERRILSSVADSEIVGVRHHYWQLGPDVARTFRAHEAAGLLYDSSIAFNDHIGFRRSVALPFQPFDPVLQRSLALVEVPTSCMDGNLFYYSDDVDAAVAAVTSLIDRVAEVGGISVLNWHVQASCTRTGPFHAWGLAYQKILSWLATRSDLWVTNLRSIADWWIQQSQEVRSEGAEPRIGVGM